MVKQERLGGSDECKASVDRISALSDDLLGSILSLLTLKEATATSILCCRWKYLWTLTPMLDFDGTELLLLHDYERAKYVRWVDRVVAAWCSRASSSTPLEEFRVYLDLTRDCTRAVDDWLRFAVSRKVERLELNLRESQL